ncbi:MAG: DUF1127 domain-containing protein [Chloroflexota bacterium]
MSVHECHAETFAAANFETASLSGRVRNFIARIQRNREEKRAEREIAALDDRMLRDIGLASPDGGGRVQNRDPRQAVVNLHLRAMGYTKRKIE